MGVFLSACKYLFLGREVKERTVLFFIIGAGCRPKAPVAEGGPIGFTDGGNRRDWFPGVRGPRAASCAYFPIEVNKSS